MSGVCPCAGTKLCACGRCRPRAPTLCTVVGFGACKYEHHIGRRRRTRLCRACTVDQGIGHHQGAAPSPMVRRSSDQRCRLNSKVRERNTPAAAAHQPPCRTPCQGTRLCACLHKSLAVAIPASHLAGHKDLPALPGFRLKVAISRLLSPRTGRRRRPNARGPARARRSHTPPSPGYYERRP